LTASPVLILNRSYINWMNNMNIKVRKAEEKDIERILEIDGAAFSHPWTKETFSEDLDDDLKAVWVAELSDDDIGINGVIAGYLDSFVMPTVEAEVLRIACDEKYRRKGIAHNLLNFMLCYCNLIAAPKILLEVREDNAPAIALYKSFNFAEDGRRKKYYDNSVDAILMSRVVSIETRNLQLDIEDGLYD